jgi:hypothetical protein
VRDTRDRIKGFSFGDRSALDSTGTIVTAKALIKSRPLAAAFNHEGA